MDRDRLAEQAKYDAMWAHDPYRDFSPGLEAVKRFDVGEQFLALGARTVLDAGCGSGKAAHHLMTRYAGRLEVRGVDIAGNCLDPALEAVRDTFLTIGCLWRREDFPGQADAVLCTDVLEHVPTERVDAVLANLRWAARITAFFGIALFDDRFGPAVLGAPLHLTVRPSAWWIERLRHAGFTIRSAFEQRENGQATWAYILAS